MRLGTRDDGLMNREYDGTYRERGWKLGYRDAQRGVEEMGFCVITVISKVVLFLMINIK